MAQLLSDSQTFFPLDASLSAHEAAFLGGIQAFAASEVAPQSGEWDRIGSLPASIWPRLGELNLWRVLIPREEGGVGLTTLGYTEMARILCSADASLGMNVAALNALGVDHLRRFGTAEQKIAYLEAAASGKLKLAWGLTEPDAGSDARRIATRGVPIPGKPGRYLLNGEKMFITNAGWADLMIAIGHVGDEGLGAFLVETAQPGFEVVRRIETIGVRASFTTHLAFRDAEAWHTPCNFAQAIGLLSRGRLGIASMALGIAEAAFSRMVSWARSRQQFNRRLVEMQTVQNFIADSATEIEAARGLIRRGAEIFDAGDDATRAASMAKLYASETAMRVTNRAIQVHGGRGMMPEYGVEQLWRDAKLTEIGEGASEIQRFIIARPFVGR